MMQTAAQTHVCWTGWHHQGLERLALEVVPEGFRVNSVVRGHDGAAPFQLTYRLLLDEHWRTRRLDARLSDGRECQLQADGAGHWCNALGESIPALAGCVDINIAATPFTNTLPIRRLTLNTGDIRILDVALLSVPALTLQSARQRYTCLSTHRYYYEGLDSDFGAELHVDDQGMVLDYPETFRRCS